MKLAIVVSHPIPYFCAQYKSWAALPSIELKVFFGSRRGLDEYYDKDFGKFIQWPRLDLGFPYEVISGCEAHGAQRNNASELDKLLDRFGAEIVLVYGYDQPLIRHAIRWARRRHAHLFMLSDAERRSRSNWLKAIAKLVILPPLLRQFDLFLTVGDSNEAFYRYYGVTDERFVRCPFPIDREVFDRRIGDAEQARRKIRAQFDIPQHHKVVLTVGKLIKRKRQKDLVACSNRLQGRRDDVTIMLVGTGPDQHALEQQSKRIGPGGVVFAGFVPPTEIIDYYFASDIYAMPSERDRHPLAISEALYAGLPVVVSDRCGSHGPTDDVRSGVNGFTYTCGATEKLLNMLLYIIDNPGLLARFSEASRRIAIENQDLAHHVGLPYAMNLLGCLNRVAG